MASSEPVAVCGLQGDACRTADDLQGRPHRHERIGRDQVSLSRRRRHPVVRGDRAGIQAAWTDGEVDPPPGRRPHPAQADREPAQDDVSRQPRADLSGPSATRLGRPAPESRLSACHGVLRCGFAASPAVPPDGSSSPDARPFHLRRCPDLRGFHPALAPHLLRRRPVRAADMGATRRGGRGPGVRREL